MLSRLKILPVTINGLEILTVPVSPVLMLTNPDPVVEIVIPEAFDKSIKSVPPLMKEAVIAEPLILGTANVLVDGL